MNSMLIFYLVYKFLELIYVTWSCHFNCYLYSSFFCLPAFPSLSLLYPSPFFIFQELLQESQCMHSRSSSKPDASKTIPQRSSLLHILVHQLKANQPSKVFSFCKLLKLPQHLYPHVIHMKK